MRDREFRPSEAGARIPDVDGALPTNARVNVVGGVHPTETDAIELCSGWGPLPLHTDSAYHPRFE